MKIAVVGGIAAGTSAAAKAKRTAKDADIIIFEASGYVSVGACGMPYYLAGYVPEAEHLIVRRPEDFEKTGIKVKVGWTVNQIDLKEGKLYAEDSSGKGEWFSFDRLVLATGATPRKLNVPGAQLEGVFYLKGYPDLLKIENYLKENNVKNVVVRGSGFIAMELVEAFVEKGFNVTSIASFMPVSLDQDIADGIPSLLDSRGVKRIWRDDIEEVQGDHRIKAIKTKSGEVIDADMLVVALGVVPNSQLAKDAGLELSVNDSIKVDERMQTSFEGVYAAGDCAHSYSAVDGSPVYLPLGSLANRHGRVAGTNVAGGNAVMPKIAGSTISKLFDLGVAKTGFNERELERRGISYKKVVIKAKDKAHYYPGSGTIKVKLLWEERTGRLLGGQIVGPYTAVKRIDVISAVICMRGTVEDLKNVDLAYAPPYSPVWDPVTVAANQAAKD